MRLSPRVLQGPGLSGLFLFTEREKLLLSRQGRLEQKCLAELCSPLLPLSPLKEHKFTLGSGSAGVRGWGLCPAPINGPAVHPAHRGGSQGLTLGGSFQVKMIKISALPFFLSHCSPSVIAGSRSLFYLFR